MKMTNIDRPILANRERGKSLTNNGSKANLNLKAKIDASKTVRRSVVQTTPNQTDLMIRNKLNDLIPKNNN